MGSSAAYTPLVLTHISGLLADRLMEWWPHTARVVSSLEAHNTPSVGKVAGTCLNEYIHAPLRGAFLADRVNGVVTVKDGCKGRSNIISCNRHIALM
jgi:hypothetical protein